MAVFTAYQLALGFWCAAAFGQGPAFEAASVKVSSSQSPRSSMRGGPGTAEPGLITFTNVTLSSVVQRAYEVKNYQVSGPEWIGSRRYDIVAKIPAGSTKETFGVMLQGLLAERFHLALHHEAREIQGFELVVGRNGPKMKTAAAVEANAASAADPAGPPKTDANGFPILDRPGLAMMEGARRGVVVVYLTAKAQPVSALVERIGREFRLPVADKSGLSGVYDFTLEFAPQPPGALPPPPVVDGSASAPDESAPNLMQAVQQQLGLRLNPAQVRVEVLVIDRADPAPVEN